MLIQHFGSASAALENANDIGRLPQFDPKIMHECKNWKTNNSWKKNVELANAYKAKIIPFTSPAYPQHLLTIPDFPVILYVQGNLLPEDNRCIAVIGTRNASIYGKEMTGKIAKDLAASGFTVISGLARGIDTAAHIGSLRSGRSIAVIGSGLSDIYPRENITLAQSISQNGAVISQFPMNTPPDRQNFPQRNTVVSGMSIGTVLIEAPIKSGAMITVERSMAFGKPIFVLPGRADMDSFKANHALIKTKKAFLIENANDIVSYYSDLFHLPTSSKPESAKMANLTPEEKDFVQKFPAHEVSIDQILQRTSLPIMKVNVLLMGLVLKKYIREFPGRIYKREQ